MTDGTFSREFKKVRESIGRDIELIFTLMGSRKYRMGADPLRFVPSPRFMRLSISRYKCLRFRITELAARIKDCGPEERAGSDGRERMLQETWGGLG